MGVQTNSALSHLFVSKAQYDQDILLQWVCQVASPLQLLVTVDKKSPLKLEAQSIVLTCRNAILRAISGTVLHDALDQHPHYLLGGSGSADSMKFPQIVQWMSVGDTVRQGSTSSSSLIPTLETHLEKKAFLVGSSQPTLADYDVALSLNRKDIDDDSMFPAFQRWYAAVMWSFQQFTPKGQSVPVSVPPPPVGPLTFYFGMEDVDAVLKPPGAPKPKANKESTDKGSSKQAEQEQDRPKAANKQDKKAKKQNASGGGGGGGGDQAPAGFDISALDIRVGKIVNAWHHKEADKLFCEDVDLGSETRQIASGLRPFYKTEDLQGLLVLVLCNLKKRSLVGFPSHGMVLCASNADHTKVEFVVPAEGSKPGDRVSFVGFESGDPEPENKVAKKKIFESLAPDLKTDANGFVIWKNAKGKTEAGEVKALNGMPDAQVS